MNRDQESVRNEINKLIPSIFAKCYSQDVSTISIRFSLLVLNRYGYIYNSDPINNLQKSAHIELRELGYEDSIINDQLKRYFSNEANVINAIRRLFPLDISILCSKICGVAELLCICYGISKEYKKHLFYEIMESGNSLTLRLKCMEESYNTLQRALSDGDLKYSGGFSSDGDYRKIKLIDFVNWRKKKISIYSDDFCVPFDETFEEKIIQEAEVFKDKNHLVIDKLRNILNQQISIFGNRVTKKEELKKNVTKEEHKTTKISIDQKRQFLQDLAIKIRNDVIKYGGKKIDKPTIIKLISICLKISITLPSTGKKYNENYSYKKGFSYHSIDNAIKDLFTSCERGNISDDEKNKLQEKIEKLSKVVLSSDYNDSRKSLNFT